MFSSLGRRFAAAAIAMSAVFATLAPASADQPHPWQLGFQEAVTPVMQNIERFHLLVLLIITVVVLFVLALLVICITRFNATSNPTPSKTSHHTGLEIAWTVVPVLILVVIAVPSFRLLYQQQVIPEADMTVKATGFTWYWSYTYPDHGDLELVSNMVPEEDLTEGQPRLLTVDQEMVVPVDKTIRVIVTGDPAGVLHSFAMPAFGIKVDAVPGRLNETWFRAEREGMYYGQCSELCGVNHAFMPIAIRVVSDEEFQAWTQEQGAALAGPSKVAAR